MHETRYALEIGQKLLTLNNQPVPRWRIVRDILRLPANDSILLKAKQAALRSKWITELRETQLPDGSWGRFHSRDSALKQRFPTTELAIRRALSLGLDVTDPLLQRALTYVRSVLDGVAAWTDPPEKHEGWPVNTRFITAATLLLLDPTDERARPSARAWVDVTMETLSVGSYSHEAEQAAHRRVNGIHTHGKHLKLAGLYPLLLLSSEFANLPANTEKVLLDWVWNKADGIYYVYSRCVSTPPALDSAHFIDWLEAVRLLCCFDYGKTLCRPAIEWLWQQHDESGLWDFGPASRDGFRLPLSESWQRSINRKIDCSVLVLSLIRNFVSGNLTANSQVEGLLLN